MLSGASMRLIFSIAAGIVLGNLAWEFLLYAAHETGRMATRAIITAARRAAERVQSTPAVQPIASVEREERSGRNVEFLESAVRKQRAS